MTPPTMLMLVFAVFCVVVGEEVTPENSEEMECETALQNLQAENERLRAELELHADDDSNESHSRGRGLARERRASGCDGGTVAQWACGPQCIYKLKGLCGLSLRAMCHC